MTRMAVVESIAVDKDVLSLNCSYTQEGHTDEFKTRFAIDMVGMRKCRGNHDVHRSDDVSQNDKGSAGRGSSSTCAFSDA